MNYKNNKMEWKYLHDRIVDATLFGFVVPALILLLRYFIFVG